MHDPRLSKGLAGIIGVAVTFAIGYRRAAPCGCLAGGATASHVSGNHHLYVPGAPPLHRLAPQCKLAATSLFVFAVVATPREAFWAFGVYAVIVVALAAARPASRLGFVAGGCVIEVPFVLFALLLPFVGQGERVEVLGVSLSRRRAVGDVEHPRQGHARRRRVASCWRPRPPCPTSCAAWSACSCP